MSPNFGTQNLQPSLEQLAIDHARVFAKRFGAGESPRVFFAPGRVNLFGAHLDYNGGPVMPTAIDRGTFVAVRRRGDRVLRMASTFDDNGIECALDSLPSEGTGRWVDYPLGVAIDLCEHVRAKGTLQEISGLDVLFGGNLPVGAGLSSSASICVAMANMLDSSWDLGLDTMGRVHSALRAERTFVGVHCGIMDPYAVGLARPGHLLWLDCKDASWRHLPMDFERVSIGVADSGVRRELARGEFNQRVAECQEAFESLRTFAPEADCLRDVPLAVFQEHRDVLSETVARRAEHVLHEVERAFQARDALLDGDLAAMGALMTETHASLRDLYEVSCPELDALADAAVATEGMFGTRLTGAGFGGCIVMLVERGMENEVREGVADAFEARFGRRPATEFFRGDEGPRELLV